MRGVKWRTDKQGVWRGECPQSDREYKVLPEGITNLFLAMARNAPQDAWFNLERAKTVDRAFEVCEKREGNLASQEALMAPQKAAERPAVPVEEYSLRYAKFPNITLIRQESGEVAINLNRDRNRLSPAEAAAVGEVLVRWAGEQ